MIEDDELIQSTTNELLEISGHSVISALNGNEALEIIEKQADAIDLILLDLSLPDMDGVELIPTLAEKAPNAHIVISSGKILDEELNSYLSRYQVKGVLQKPYDLLILKETIDKILQG
mgnify:CR=1 FL=1